MADRSKYRSSSSEELQMESDKIREREASARNSFLKVEPGINVFRLFPAPLKAKSSLFCFPCVTAFLPLLVDEYDKEKKEKTGKKIEKRRPVFNAKVHGNLKHDLVEEYISCANEYFSAIYTDSKQVLAKMKIITDFKKGIKPSSSWISYAYKLVGSSKTYGRLQMTDGVHKQLDALSLRQSDSGKPIIVDLFSHPDTGKMIQWTSNPTDPDNKNKNKVNILFERDSPLTDEELDMLEEWESLESLYKNCFKRNDFEKQLEGLQRFDENNKLGVFNSPAFQNIIDICKAELDEAIPESEEEETQEETVTVAKEEPKQAPKPAATSDNNIPEILAEMDKKTLQAVIEKLELPIEVKLTTPPSKLRIAIVAAIAENFELDPSDSEGITSLIENAFEEAGEESEPEPEPEEEAPAPVEPEKPKSKNRSSLLDKYRKKD